MDSYSVVVTWNCGGNVYIPCDTLEVARDKFERMKHRPHVHQVHLVRVIEHAVGTWKPSEHPEHICSLRPR